MSLSGRGCMLWNPEPGGLLFQAMAGVASTRAAVQGCLEPGLPPRGALHSYWTCCLPIRTFWIPSYVDDPDWRATALLLSEELCHLAGQPYEGSPKIQPPRFKAGLSHTGHSSKPMHRTLPSANTALGLLLLCPSYSPRKKLFAPTLPSFDSLMSYPL